MELNKQYSVRQLIRFSAEHFKHSYEIPAYNLYQKPQKTVHILLIFSLLHYTFIKILLQTVIFYKW